MFISFTNLDINTREIDVVEATFEGEVETGIQIRMKSGHTYTSELTIADWRTLTQGKITFASTDVTAVADVVYSYDEALGASVDDLTTALGTNTTALTTALGTQVTALNTAAGTNTTALTTALATQVTALNTALGTNTTALTTALGTQVTALNTAAGTNTGLIVAAIEGIGGAITP